MPTETHANFVWRDLMSHDPEGARRFYTELFGWGTRQVPLGPHGTYTMWIRDGEPLGGLVAFDDSRQRSHWIAYVETDALEVLLERVLDQGGQVCVPATPIPEVGTFAVIQDAQGALLSLIERSHGASPIHTYAGEPGAFCWAELHARSREDADDFYGRILGWTAEVQDVGLGVPYAVYHRDGRPTAGARQDDPARLGARWVEYVCVADIERATARVVALGGELLDDIVTMRDRGRGAIIADPQGAAMALFEMP